MNKPKEAHELAKREKAKSFRENFPTKEQVTKQVAFGVNSWDFTDYFNEKLEELSTEIWEDGYSFGIYKVKEIIEEIIGDGKIAYNKELDILKEKINNLK